MESVGRLVNDLIEARETNRIVTGESIAKGARRNRKVREIASYVYGRTEKEQNGCLLLYRGHPFVDINPFLLHHNGKLRHQNRRRNLLIHAGTKLPSMYCPYRSHTPNPPTIVIGLTPGLRTDWSDSPHFTKLVWKTIGTEQQQHHQ